MRTKEGTAAGTTVEPQSDRILVAGPMDRLDEDVVEGAVGVFNVQVARIDTGVVVIWVSLGS